MLARFKFFLIVLLHYTAIINAVEISFETRMGCEFEQLTTNTFEIEKSIPNLNKEECLSKCFYSSDCFTVGHNTDKQECHLLQEGDDELPSGVLVFTNITCGQAKGNQAFKSATYKASDETDTFQYRMSGKCCLTTLNHTSYSIIPMQRLTGVDHHFCLALCNQLGCTGIQWKGDEGQKGECKIYKASGQCAKVVAKRRRNLKSTFMCDVYCEKGSNIDLPNDKCGGRKETTTTLEALSGSLSSTTVRQPLVATPKHETATTSAKEQTRYARTTTADGIRKTTGLPRLTSGPSKRSTSASETTSLPAIPSSTGATRAGTHTTKAEATKTITPLSPSLYPFTRATKLSNTTSCPKVPTQCFSKSCKTPSLFEQQVQTCVDPCSITVSHAGVEHTRTVCIHGTCKSWKVDGDECKYEFKCTCHSPMDKQPFCTPVTENVTVMPAPLTPYPFTIYELQIKINNMLDTAVKISPQGNECFEKGNFSKNQALGAHKEIKLVASESVDCLVEYTVLRHIEKHAYFNELKFTVSSKGAKLSVSYISWWWWLTTVTDQTKTFQISSTTSNDISKQFIIKSEIQNAHEIRNGTPVIEAKVSIEPKKMLRVRPANATKYGKNAVRLIIHNKHQHDISVGWTEKICWMPQEISKKHGSMISPNKTRSLDSKTTCVKKQHSRLFLNINRGTGGVENGYVIMYVDIKRVRGKQQCSISSGLTKLKNGKDLKVLGEVAYCGVTKILTVFEMTVL